MKKYLMGIIAIAFAIAGSAFTAPANLNHQTNDPLLHWFAPNGSYLGQRTVSAQEGICNGNEKVCASGYSEITEDEEPVVETFEQDVLKP